MKRLGEAIRSILLRERPLQRFEEAVGEGGAFSFSVFLKQGTEYVVRGRVSRGGAIGRVSLLESTGVAVPIRSDDKKMYFSVVPEKDGLYQIRALVEDAGTKGVPATISVSLSSACIPPPYIMGQSVIPAYLAARPELRHRLAGEAAAIAPDMEVACGQTQAG